MATSEVLPTTAVSPGGAGRQDWHDRRLVATWLIALGFLLEPMAAIQLFSGSDVNAGASFVPLGDVVILLGYATLIPLLLRRRLFLSPIYLAAVLGIFLSCMASLEFVASGSAVYRSIVRLIFEIGVLPAGLMLWRPQRKTLAMFSGAYVLGTLSSVLNGLLTHNDEDGRLVGLTLHPNGMGIVCAFSLVMIPFVVSVWPRAKWWGAGVALVLLFALNLSGSREAVVALGVSFVVGVMLERSSLGLAALTSMVAAVLALIPQLQSQSGDNVLARLSGSGSASDATGQRAEKLQDGLDQVFRHPILGNGFGDVRSWHNTFVQVWASLGLVAMLCYLVLLLLPASALLGSGESKRLGYIALTYLALGPFTDSVWDSIIWAPMALALAALPVRESGGAATRYRHTLT